MKAYDHEIEKAKSDGVEFVFWSMPIEIAGNGAVTSLNCRGTEMVDDDLVPVDGSDFTLDVTRVLRATGQAKRTPFLAQVPDVTIDNGGRVEVDEHYRTANPKVWAGGDCVNGGKEVVNAVDHGKRAAIDIDIALTKGR